MDNALKNSLSSFFAGPYGWALKLLLVIVFAALFNFLAKQGLDRLHRRFEPRREIWKDSFVQTLFLPLSTFVWYLAIIQALTLLVGSKWKALVQMQSTFIWTGAVVAIAWFLFRWKNKAAAHLIHKSRIQETRFDPTKIDALNKVASAAILFFTTLLLLEITGQSLTTLIAFGGIGGLALAIAAQEIIANFFGGLMIYTTQPFSIGDTISLPEKEMEGSVEEIGWYMTRIRMPDKRPVYIPNSIFSKILLINHSRMSHRQIKELMGLSAENISKLKLLIKDIQFLLDHHPEIDHHLPTIVRFFGFGQYSLDIQVQCYTRTIDYPEFLRVKEDVNFKIAELLMKHGCRTAVPEQNLRISRSTQNDIVE